MTRSVAFVLWDGVVGGAERQTTALARALTRLGYRTRVVVLGQSDPLEAMLASDLDVVALGFARGRDALGRPEALREALAGFDVCVLPSNGFLVGVCRGVTRVLVAMEHGDALNARALLGPVRRMAYRFARGRGARALDAEIAVSETAAAALRRLPHAARVEVIHNGLEVEAFRPSAPADVALAGQATIESDAPFAIGSLGRLVEGKGFEALIDGVALAAAASPVILRIGGDGPLRAALEARAQAAGIAERVHFEGWVDDVPAFWAGCDAGVLVNDALTESFGLASVEALASGVPVVVRGSATERELLAGAPGVTALATASEREIAAALVTLVSAGRPETGSRLARWAWVADKYAIDVCARRYDALFGSLLDDAATRQG